MKCGINSHTWVHEQVVSTSFPVKQRMICRACGELRTVTLWTPTYEVTFEELYQKFYGGAKSPIISRIRKANKNPVQRPVNATVVH